MEEGIAHARQGRGIRWHLFQVLLVSIVPIGLFAAGLLYLRWQTQEHERERAQLQSVRLLAAAVDNALDSTVERLSILARLWGSKSVSDEEIYTHAKEAVQVNPDWADVLALRADGSVVFRTDVPLGGGTRLTEPFDPWRRVVAQRTPVVSDVAESPGRRDIQGVSVGVPVVHGPMVTHVLIARLDLSWYDRLLRRQGLPEGGVAGLFDPRFKFVARSTEGAERRGGDPTEALVADMKRKREGIGKYTNLNGTSVYTTWTATRHGWWVGLATPAAPIDDPFWRQLAIFGCVWAAAVGAGILYAFSKARLISASLKSLENQARHLAAARRIADLPASRVVEIDRTLAALEEASVLLQSAMQQRDHSLGIEREARAAAEAASRAKDEFLAMLGHELRNPLGAISNAATVMTLDGRSQEQTEFAAGVISRQSHHLKRLIDDLLDVGRVVAGKIALELRPLDLGDSVRSVFATLEAGGRLADRRFELDTAPAWVNGDRTRIEQIITNLLVNAATYTKPGGHVRVTTSCEGDEAILRVSDDGRGIAPENLARVFDLFFQAETTMDRATGGLGIGLTLVQRLARLHGGAVTVDSPGRGQGTSFTVRFPAVSEPESAPTPAVAASVREARTVLVVEDNADSRESLRLALELRGYRVLPAADAPAALDLMQREHATVAVLDIGLPGMDGYQLGRRLRRAFGRDIVLIALTGYGRGSDAEKGVEAGFDQHLTKPVDLNELAQAIETAGRSTGAPASS